MDGHLCVSGCGDLEIPLKHRPENTFVYFSEDPSCHPCNPGSNDYLEWEVVHTHGPHSHHEYLLIIKWNVSSMREVIWRID